MVEALRQDKHEEERVNPLTGQLTGRPVRDDETIRADYAALKFQERSYRTF